MADQLYEKLRRSFRDSGSLDVAAEKAAIFMRRKESLDAQTLKLAVKLSLDVDELINFGVSVWAAGGISPPPKERERLAEYERTKLAPVEKYIRDARNAEKRAAIMTRSLSARAASSIAKISADALISGHASRSSAAKRGTCCTCLTTRTPMCCSTCGHFLCFECVKGNAAVNRGLLSCPGNINGRRCVGRWTRADLRKLAENSIVQSLLIADAAAYDASFEQDTRRYFVQGLQELVRIGEDAKRLFRESTAACEALIATLASSPFGGRGYYMHSRRRELSTEETRAIRHVDEEFSDAQAAARARYSEWVTLYRRILDGNLAEDGNLSENSPEVAEPRRYGCSKCKGFFVCEGAETKCNSCLAPICHLCHEPRGDAHECAAGSAASIALMIKNSQSCPRCFLGVQRSSGCDQMFCTICNTAFSYSTGRAIPASENIHNPHFFSLSAELRQQINSSRGGQRGPARQRELACEVLPSRQLEIVVESGVEALANQELANRILEAFRYASHLVANGATSIAELERSLEQLRPERFGRVERVAALLPEGETFEKLVVSRKPHASAALVALSKTAFSGPLFEVVSERVFLNTRSQLAEKLVDATEAYNLASARITLKTAFVACVTELVRMAAAEMGSSAALLAIDGVWSMMELDDVDDIVRFRVDQGRGRATQRFNAARPPAPRVFGFASRQGGPPTRG